MQNRNHNTKITFCPYEVGLLFGWTILLETGPSIEEKGAYREVRLLSEKKFKLFLARTGYDSSHPPQSITSHSLFTGIHVGGTRAIVNPPVEFIGITLWNLWTVCVCKWSVPYSWNNLLRSCLTHLVQSQLVFVCTCLAFSVWVLVFVCVCVCVCEHRLVERAQIIEHSCFVSPITQPTIN